MCGFRCAWFGVNSFTYFTNQNLSRWLSGETAQTCRNSSSGADRLFPTDSRIHVKEWPFESTLWKPDVYVVKPTSQASEAGRGPDSAETQTIWGRGRCLRKLTGALHREADRTASLSTSPKVLLNPSLRDLSQPSEELSRTCVCSSVWWWRG